LRAWGYQRVAVFRGETAVASLKLREPQGAGVVAPAVFHGETAAASLKLDDRRDLVLGKRGVFGGMFAAASLKQRPHRDLTPVAGRSSAAFAEGRTPHAVRAGRSFRGTFAAASLKAGGVETESLAAAVSTRPAALWIGCGELEPEMLFRHP
jgi:hypothetical protein